MEATVPLPDENLLIGVNYALNGNYNVTVFKLDTFVPIKTIAFTPQGGTTVMGTPYDLTRLGDRTFAFYIGNGKTVIFTMNNLEPVLGARDWASSE
jgi:hypothetical protein